VKGVTHMFLRSGMTVKAVLQPESGDEIRVMKCAVQWLAEEGTREWVTELNFEIGAARQNACVSVFVAPQYALFYLVLPLSGSCSFVAFQVWLLHLLLCLWTLNAAGKT